jgi:hypothetical protein
MNDDLSIQKIFELLQSPQSPVMAGTQRDQMREVMLGLRKGVAALPVRAQP